MKRACENIIKSIVSWLLVLAMMCSDVVYVWATDVSGNEVVQEASIDETESSEIIEEDDSDYKKDVARTDAIVLDVDGNIASGTWCGMEWVIESNGLLTISGHYGEYNEFDTNWIDYAASIKSVKVTASQVDYTGWWFIGCENLTSVNLKEFDTSNVRDMAGMFSECESLSVVDVSGFDTSQVRFMGRMFENCKALTSIDVSSFDTQAVTDMSGMFAGCENLKSLDVSGFNTSEVTYMSYMFEDCAHLNELDVSGFDTSKVTSMSGMFAGCENLKSLDVSGFNTSEVTDMSYMFEDCAHLNELDVSGFDTSKVTNMQGMFSINGSKKEWNYGIRELDVSGWDTSNVEDMGWMFLNCSSLTQLEVSGFNTERVTDMEAMFAGCTSLTRLDVSHFNTSKVTSTYHMFSSCAKLTDLDVSGFNTSEDTNMCTMFSGCHALTNLDISNFDTGNVVDMHGLFRECKNIKTLDVTNFDVSKVTDMNELFSGCENLKSLNLSQFNASNVTEAREMFEGCPALTSIKTMRNVNIDIALPSPASDMPATPMYDAEGISYTTMPKGLSEGIWLAADPDNVPSDTAKSINKLTNKIDTENTGIVVYDRYTHLIVENASVEIDGETYISSETVLLPVSESSTEKSVTISAEGYFGLTTTVTLTKGKITYIALTPAKSELAIISVKASYNGSEHELLGQEIKLSYVPGIDTGLTTVKKDLLYITVASEGEASKYELLQDGQVITSSTDGNLSVQVIKGDDKTTYSKKIMVVTDPFVAVKPIYLRITGSDGKQVTEKLGIKISSSSVSESVQEQKGKIALKEKLELKVPENVPLVGGSEFKIGLDENRLPFDLEIDEDGKVKIAINKKTDDSIERFKQECKNREKYAARQFLNGMTGEKFGGGFFEAEAQIYGYGEGNLSEWNGGELEISVGIYAEIKGKGGYKQYFMAGVLPVYLFIEGSVSGKPELKCTVRMEDYQFSDFIISDGSFNAKLEINVGGGVGVELLTALKVSGKGSVNYIWKPARNYEKAWLNASLKISQVSLAVYEYTYYDSPEYERVLYERGKDESPIATSSIKGADRGKIMSRIESVQVDPEPAAQVLSRKYLAYTSGYQELEKQVNPATIQAVSEQSALTRKVIKSAVLPSADAKLVQAGTKKYLFWLEDIITRSAMNRAALVYSVSEDGVNWSAPQQLISEAENKTLDCGFDLAVSGDKIYVVWQDAEKEYADNAELLTVASGLQIRTAVLDTASGKVSVLPGREAATAGCYLYPQISTGVAADDSHTYVCYALNDLGSKDFSGNNKFTVYFDDYEQDKLGNSRTIALPDNYQPFDMKLGMFGGKLYAICDMDTDGNNATSEDREIELIDVSEGTISKLTDNASADCNPVLTDAGGLYWNSADGIKKVSALGAEPTLVTNAINAFTNYSYEVAANGGHDWIFYEGHSAEGNTLSLYGIGERENGTYSNPIEFTTISGNIISKLSGIGDADYIYLTGLEGDFLQDGTLLQDLCLYRIGDIADICVEEVSYDETTAAPGTALHLRVVLYNKGNVTVNEATVQVDGNTIATLQNLNLLPGESTELEVDGYVVPETVSKPENHTLSVALADEAVTDDNSREFTVGYPDFAVETDTRYSGEHTWLDIYVTNTSQFNASGTVFVHRAEEDGEVIFQKAFSDLSSEEVWNSTLSLADYESRDVKYYVEVVSDSDEGFVGDNEEFVYIGFGTGIEQEVKASESVEITGITLAKTVAAMKVGDSQKLTLATQPVAELPASEFLWDSSNARVVSVDEVGNIKALMPGTSKVTVYYGDLSATCTVTVVENATDPITIFFDTQQAQRVAPMTGIIPGNQLQLPMPEKVKDKTFIGWYTEAEGGTLVNEDTAFYQTATLYAHWRDGEFELYTLTFDVNGGKALDGKEITRQVFEGDAYGELPVTIREGYSFEGWYTAADGGEKVTAETICKGNVTLYAHWKKNGDNPDIGTDDGDDGILHIAAKGKVDAAAAIMTKLTPDEAARIKKYKSSSSKIATVNKKGIVTGRKDGTATITAYEKVGKKYVELASVEVEVKKPVFKFTKTILQKNEEIDPCDYISNLPKGAKVTWSVPVKKAPIATLNEDGIIVPGGKSGSVKVTCIIGEGAYAAKYIATLKFKLPKLAATTKVKVGKAKRITVSNVPKDAKIEWDWKTASGTLDIQTTKKPNAVKVTVPDETVKEAEVYAIVNGVQYETKLVIQ